MKPLLPNSVASKVLCAGYVFRRASTRWSVMQNLVAVASAAFLTLGCTTFAADRYSVSTDTHMELKAAAEAREELIAVDEFTASKPGITGITCRVWSLIKTPDGGTFESFIRQALIDELTFAEIYSLEGAVRLKGNLDRIESGSMSGIWRLALTVSDTAGRSFWFEKTMIMQSVLILQMLVARQHELLCLLRRTSSKRSSVIRNFK